MVWEASPHPVVGVNSSSGKTDWVKREGEQIRISYPGSQAWGATFVTVGTPSPPPHLWRDLSPYGTLSIDMRGTTGGEAVDIGIKADTSPDDGSEVKATVRLTQTWRAYIFRLSGFKGIDLTRLYVVAEFVFKGSKAETIYVRSVRYLNQEEVDRQSNSTDAFETNSTPQPNAMTASSHSKASGKPILSKPMAGNRATMPPWSDIKIGVSAKYPDVTKLEPSGEFLCTRSPDPTIQIWDWPWDRSQENVENRICRYDAYGTQKSPQDVLYRVQIAALFKFSKGKWQFWQYAIRRQ